MTYNFKESTSRSHPLWYRKKIIKLLHLLQGGEDP